MGAVAGAAPVRFGERVMQEHAERVLDPEQHQQRGRRDLLVQQGQQVGAIQGQRQHGGQPP